MRLIEVYISQEQRTDLDSVLEDLSVVDVAGSTSPGERAVVRLLVHAKHSGAVLDALEQRFGREKGFRAVLLKVEATLPRPEEEEAAEETGVTVLEEVPGLRFGVSREELYARVLGGTEVSQTFVLTVVLSAIVVAVGLWRDDLAVIIGAMVIAPLLGPNVALALATTLADEDLTRKALRANLSGVAIALSVALIVGAVFPVDPTVSSIASRTVLGPGDVVLALAAGCAAALAYTTSVPAALIGVMVAVALLPPLVVFGMLGASGYWSLALGAAVLLLTNVICVNLSGVLTFLWQGVGPRTWWEAKRAKQRTRRAIAVWLLLLAVLIGVTGVAFGT